MKKKNYIKFPPPRLSDPNIKICSKPETRIVFSGLRIPAIHDAKITKTDPSVGGRAKIENIKNGSICDVFNSGHQALQCS